jgi:Fur family transcriptional regulator, ferric uptake regulator
MTEHCNSVQILSEFRLSKTPHRICVLGLLIQAKQALSAGAIAGMLKGRRGINKVTVYRMLNTFKHAGIIREIATEGGIKHYEMACVHNPVHPHFYCLQCGVMACLTGVSPPEYGNWLSGRPFKVQNIAINLSGVCAQCQKKD